MKVKQIFDLAVKLGIKNDLRGEKKVSDNLKKVKARFAKLSDEQKKEFDEEALSNPYLDSRILFDSKKEVKKIYAGIDIDVSELLLSEKIGGIDLVLAHHPLGKGLASLAQVMPLQVEVLADYGVPINVAQGCFKMRIDEVSRGVSPANHFKTVDAATALKISLMCCHTVCDNLVANFLKKQLVKKKFEQVSEILDFLKTIPEYAEAMKRGAGPRLFAGAPDNYCGKIALTEITGGTEGAKEIYAKMADAGIGTIIGMHMSEANKKEAEKHHINAIIAGHISSDSIGVNLLLDELEKRGVKVIAGSGIIRVKRFK